MSALINPELTAEQRVIFFEVIEESLRVNHKPDLFNFLQHGIQYLIGHNVMIYGLKHFENDQYDFEFFTSTLEFTDKHFEKNIQNGNSLIYSSIKKWQENQKTLFVSDDIVANEFPSYSIYQTSSMGDIDNDLKRYSVHGFGDSRNDMSSIVFFAHMTAPANALTAYFIDLIMPSLHCALLRVHQNRFSSKSLSNQDAVVKTITKRELEVLEWLNIGKTNWEISEILGISPTTVKNHVQNIIRKLGVENRNQAAKKSVSLGLISQSQFKYQHQR